MVGLSRLTSWAWASGSAERVDQAGELGFGIRTSVPGTLVARSLSGLVRLTRAAALTAIVALASLVAWRYAMHEPIGVSLARYSQQALAALPW